ncbi:MAG: helix-turn-helix domain-containing protein [Burkholderiales bacterium]
MAAQKSNLKIDRQQYSFHRWFELAEEREGMFIIERCPTQKDMASQVGASREMISRIMKELSDGRYLVVDRRRVSFSRPLPKAW